MKIRISCFYGDASPGAVIEVDKAEHDRLVALKAGVSAGDAEMVEHAEAKPKAKAGPVAEEGADASAADDAGTSEGEQAL